MNPSDNPTVNPDLNINGDNARKSRGPNALRGVDWFLLTIAYGSLFAFGIADNARGPVFPDVLREFDLTDSIGSLFFLMASGAALVNNVVLFSWLQKIGAYRNLQVYSAVQALGLIIIGFAPNYLWVLVGSVLFGASLGGLGIAHNVLVADGARGENRRRALSALHGMYGVASLLAPLYVNWFYGWNLAWRDVLGWIAIGPIAVFLLSLKRRPPKVDVVSPIAPAPLAETAAETAAEPSFKAAITAGLPRRSAIFFGLMLALYVVAELAIGTRLALYARRDAGFSVEAANWMVSGYFLLMFVGRVTFAIFQSTLGSRPILWVSSLSAIVTFSLGLLVNPLWLVVTGLTLAPFYPVTISLANEEFGEHAGYVVSWCITMQALLLMAMHFVIGALSDAFGLGVALWIGPVSLVGVVILLAGKLTRPARV